MQKAMKGNPKPPLKDKLLLNMFCKKEDPTIMAKVIKEICSLGTLDAIHPALDIPLKTVGYQEVLACRVFCICLCV